MCRTTDKYYEFTSAHASISGETLNIEGRTADGHVVIRVRIDELEVVEKKDESDA